MIEADNVMKIKHDHLSYKGVGIVVLYIFIKEYTKSILITHLDLHIAYIYAFR